ncbi:caspase family protein, partial [Cyanobacteria bacterium FACHB-502]|nr:caspase family protein [Cyanobacteria bacterium FACHB-502]
MDNSEALLIGIQKYAQTDIFSPLSTNIDVRNVSEVLRDSKYKISGRILNPDQTTTEALKRALKSFLASDGRSGEVLIYISGHGYQEVDQEIVERKLNGYLATSDCRVKLEDNSISNSPVLREGPAGLSLNWLNQLIHQSNRSSVVLLIDACHSGHAALQASLLQSSFTRGRLRNFHVIAACQDGETAKSQEKEGIATQRGGIFTRYLVEGLSQETGYRNPEGKITSGILFEFIYRKLTNPDFGGTVKQRPIHANYADAPIILKECAPLPQESSLIVAPLPPVLDPVTGQLLHPYPGLDAFEEKHAELFFGREDVIDLIRHKLERPTFVPIIGASGSGKSSVVKAGLIPALRKEDDWRVLEPIKPGRYALMKLTRSLAQGLKGYISSSILESLEFSRTTDEVAAAMPAFVSAVASLPASPRFLLFVDQFEEIFTLVAKEHTKDIGQNDNSLPQADQALFIELLTQTALEPGSSVSAVMTMRADFVGDCLRYEALYRQIQGNSAIFMPPMKLSAYERAIVEPARRQGGNIEPKLLAALLNDAVSEPGSLPLLQFALEQLWDSRNQENELTWDAYNALGRVKGAEDSESGTNTDNRTAANGLKRALNVYADEIYQNTLEKEACPSRTRNLEEQEWIRRIFVNLVRTGEGSTDTRQRQLEADLLGIVKDSIEQRDALKALIDDLVHSRLLVRGDADPTVIQAVLKQHPDASEVAGKQPDAIKMVDLAHEALISGWRRFATWLQEDREVRRIAEQMQDARRKWKAVAPEKKTEYLMMGALLSQAKEYWRSDKLQPYLLDSQEDTQNETDSKTFYTLSDQYEKSSKLKLQQALLEAEVQFKAASSNNKLAEGNRLEALTLAIQAAGQNRERLSHKMLGLVQQSLFKFVDPIFPHPEIRSFEGHTGDVYAVALSRDGQTIVSGSSDKTVRLWSLDGTLLRTLTGHTGYVRAVALSRDGQTIVSGSDDSTVRLWNLDGTLLRTLTGHTGAVYDVALSRDGQTIVSGSSDSTVRLWNLDGTLL